MGWPLPTGKTYSGRLTEFRVYEQQEPSSALYNESTVQALHDRLDILQERVSKELVSQGFDKAQIQLERMLHMRFDGSDTSLMM